jgi:hypothetical protein
MDLMKQLLQLAADLLVIVGEPDDCVAICPDSMDVYVRAWEPLQIYGGKKRSTVGWQAAT